MKAFVCSNCGEESITERFLCPKCQSREFVKKDIPEVGEVYSYTTIHVAPPEYAYLAPYHVVLVKLSDRLKVTALMKEKVSIGDKVQFISIQNGAYIFEKVE
jgi:uncharacterized protein